MENVGGLGAEDRRNAHIFYVACFSLQTFKKVSNTSLPSLVHDEQGRETNSNCLPQVMVTPRNTALAELSENQV